MFLPGAHIEGSQIEPARLPRELGPAQNALWLAVGVQADAARKKRRNREVEERGAIKEEAALLWEEQRKAGQVDAPRVDLCFSKVGVDRADGPQARRDVVRDLSADVRRTRAIDLRSPAWARSQEDGHNRARATNIRTRIRMRKTVSSPTGTDSARAPRRSSGRVKGLRTRRSHSLAIVRLRRWPASQQEIWKRLAVATAARNSSRVWACSLQDPEQPL